MPSSLPPEKRVASGKTRPKTRVTAVKVTESSNGTPRVHISLVRKRHSSHHEGDEAVIPIMPSLSRSVSHGSAASTKAVAGARAPPSPAALLATIPVTDDTPFIPPMPSPLPSRRHAELASPPELREEAASDKPARKSTTPRPDTPERSTRVSLAQTDRKSPLDTKLATLGEAQSTLNHLQTMLDTYPLMRRELRRSFVQQVSEIVQKHDILPYSLYCSSLRKHGDNPVARGGFADIWKGKYSGEIVAVKALRFYTASSTDRRELWKSCKKEAIVWRQLHHENILRFIGINEDLFHPSFCLISPWMKNGNILQYLDTHPTHSRLDVMIDILAGLDYLHTLDPPVIHADIRGANIVVKDNGRCCLADFGLALLSETMATMTSTVRGSMRWLPPEALESAADSYKPPRDMYSFACTVIEIYTGRHPFPNLKNDGAVVLAVTVQNKRPNQPSARTGMTDIIWSHVKRCFRAAPSTRPTAEEILESLRLYRDHNTT
ncbi:kinase-like protein [Cylindrobasidium torrendii FP15055 ss-10]|uniref:Kinase-like protein n=1 Tax=Cylindrobasidium torrendii FP15055 ss-10 TaxID=1314674 RepID=A0A0D7B9M3_9AGAR|nr:kinase-like protein [Cylindrobasidium torrendii FP15055 ss-10]